jgi:pre-mRNA-splicing factor ATP-dependent RNA helicase DHX15/PRP43
MNTQTIRKSGRFYDLQKKTNHLPINNSKCEFIQKFNSNNLLIINGTPGCGKSTQIPKWEAEITNKPMICSQPRRIAVISIAISIAQELDVVLGEEVGYVSRFDSSISENTKIKIVTDGILLNEILNNQIRKYNVILVDEIHIRSINIDLILCLLNSSVFNKCNINIIIMSATMEVAKFQKFFNIEADCVINVGGKIFPVDIFYAPVDVVDYFKYSINIVEQILKFETKNGDILIFLNGKDEILAACNEINDLICGLGIEIYIK